MNTNLHDALLDMAAEGGDPREAPTSHLLTRVRRRRTAQTTARSVVGVAAAGAVALGVTTWASRPGSAPMPATDVSAPEPSPDATPDVTPDPAQDDPVADAVVPVWDLVPDSTLDLTAAPERAVTEALAAIPIMADDSDTEVLYLLDAADNTWVRYPWPSPDAGSEYVAALSPDGRYVAHSIWDGERSQMQLTELATGASTDVAPLVVDGVECQGGLSSYSPDGESLAVLAVCDPEVMAGPVAVFDVDPATGDAALIARFDGVNEVAALAYSPDGSRLAVNFHDVAEPYTPRAVVLDADGTVLQEWAAELTRTPWYGNDALRASSVTSTDEGVWLGYLLVGSGETVGEVRPSDENPWVYGTPPEPALGATHGQFVVMSPNYPTAAFLIEDAATGATRPWLRIANLGESWTALRLLHRAR